MMGNMKIRLLIPLMLSLAGCSSMTTDSWNWLDDPKNQKWVEVVITGDDWKIELKVPDKQTAGKARTKFTPPLKHGAENLYVNVLTSEVGESRRLVYVEWEHWWGGFLKESGVDFFLDIWVFHNPGRNVPESNLDDRVEQRISQWEAEFAGLDSSDPGIRDHFFSDYEVGPYTSAQGLEWVVENSPHKYGQFKAYLIPLSEHLTLDIGFFVNQKRYDWKDDPEWNERRWALSRKILDTVTITRMN
jgi:hypothetical protein